MRHIRARFKGSSVASGSREGSRKVVLDPALGLDLGKEAVRGKEGPTQD